jgi:ADP-ribose pyrophosphatase
MAEGWARSLANGLTDPTLVVTSAGLEAHGLNPGAVTAMARHGVDISGHTSKLLSDQLVADADVIVTVCGHADAHCPVLPPHKRRIHLPFDDPAKAKGSPAEVEACFDRVCEEIHQGVTQLLQQEFGLRPSVHARFGVDDFQILERQRSHTGFVPIDVLQLTHRRFQGGWSDTLRREVAVRPQAVGVLLFDPVCDAVVLVRQFRAGLVDEGQSPWILEIVAGLMAAGEAPVDVVKREAKEETNCAVSDLIPICEYFNSPGWSNEKISLFCARVDASTAGGVYGLDEEHEDILVVVMPFREAVAAVTDGTINNAMAVIAIQWLELNQEKVRRQWQTTGQNH